MRLPALRLDLARRARGRARELDNAGASDADIHQITWENSCRHFGYDPFKGISREHATVGKLRALSPDVDTSTKTRAQWRESYEAAHAS